MNTLDAVIKGLNEAVAALKLMTAKARQAVADADILVAEVKAEEAKIKERESLVKLREDAVTSIEATLMSAEALTIEKDKVEAALAALSNDRQTFNRACSEKKAVLDQQEANLKDDRAALDAAWKVLESEKTNYKTKILEEITKKVGK